MDGGAHAPVRERLLILIERNLAQCHNDPDSPNRRSSPKTIRPAAVNSSSVGLLAGGAQRTDARDIAIGEREAIILVNGSR